MSHGRRKKVLISQGFGAGWVSWAHSREQKEFLISYQPIIDFLEAGGKFSYEECRVEYDWDDDDAHPNLSNLHPILRTLAEECLKRFDDIPYLGGARSLEVRMVDGRIRIHEYDGKETMELEGEYDDWF